MPSPLSPLSPVSPVSPLMMFGRLLTGRKFGRLEAGFLLIVAVALGMRLWELGSRTIHYDEAIHIHFAWRLVNSDGAFLGWPWVFGRDFLHSAWMHGPFQVELTAFIFRVFGDTEVTARLGYALFGTALVSLPYFLRDYLGRSGAILAAVMLALSPSLLYFSRFGRNDIIMVFFASALLILMWRYLQEGRRSYLYLSSAVLALMFATKETAYLVVAVFGLLMFILALPDIIPWLLGRVRLAREGTPAAFLLLLVTLTIPQWVAIVGLFQGALGLTLANPDPNTGQNVPNADGSEGLVGAPAWAGRTLLLPVTDLPWGAHAAVIAVGLGVLIWLARRKGLDVSRVLGMVGAPLLATAASALLLFRPMSQSISSGGVPVADLAVSAFLLVTAVGVLAYHRRRWQIAALLLFVPVLVTALYSILFTPVVDVQAVVDAILPSRLTIGTGGNAVPANYVVALVLLIGSLIASVVVGVRWMGGAWLVCAGIFYLIWAALYTTLFTNMAGLFSGSWQGMGYWIAQQDVARGNQPWYYYFIGLSVYELLPVVFGVVAAVYFVKKGDILGLALAFWAGLSFLAYTVASEKMPWLLVNMTVPFIFLAAKFLGELADRVRWREAAQKGAVALLFLAPLSVVGGVNLLFTFVDRDGGFSAGHWAMLAATAILVAAAAILMRTVPAGRGAPIVAMGLAILLLGFGTWGAVRAGYTFDDSNKELLVYAQGSADLVETFRDLDRQVLSVSGPEEIVQVDYDIWYPFVWYVRDHDRDGRLRFSCFKSEGESGWNDSCKSLDGENAGENADGTPEDRTSGLSAVLVASPHVDAGTGALDEFQKSDRLDNLLWFPESYRRPDENRPAEGFGEEIRKDFRYFKDTLTSKDAWQTALDYLLFRNLDDPWFNSEFYSFRR